MGLAAEGLEIRVLHPSRAHGFFGQTLDVLQQVKPHHQPCRQPGAADMLHESRTVERIEPVPIDAGSQLDTRKNLALVSGL